MQPTVMPILATPMGVVPLPEAAKWNAAVAEVVTHRAAADASGGPSGANRLTYVGTDDLMAWSEAPVRAVMAEILRGIAWVARSVNRFTSGEFESFALQARAACVIVHQNGGLPARNCPMSGWTAIYCVEAPEPAAERPDSGALRIYESRLGNMFADATLDTMALPFRPGHYGWTLAPGVLVVFPGSLMHEIAPVRGAGRLLALTVRARFLAPGQKGVSGW